MPFDQVLLALANADLGNTTLNPPSAGWPTPGEDYRLLIVDSVNNQTTLARSQAFEIEEPKVNNTSSTVRSCVFRLTPLEVTRLTWIFSSSSSTIPRNTATQQPGAIPSDTTIDDNNNNDDGGVASLKVPAAFAVTAALLSTIFL